MMEDRDELGRFVKGMTTWNKGIKGVHHSPETEFKKGQVSPMKGRHQSPEARLINKFSHIGQKGYWKGKCRSKETIEKVKKNHKGMLGKHRSPEDKIKISENTKIAMNNPTILEKMRLGNEREKNPNWQGGISFEPYGTEFNKHLKEQIRKRDGYRCQECFRHQDELFKTKNGFKHYKLFIHHIDYDKNHNKPANLISLCLKCHIKTNLNRTHWKNYFRMKMFIKEFFNPENILIFNENKQLIGMERIWSN